MSRPSTHEWNDVLQKISPNSVNVRKILMATSSIRLTSRKYQTAVRSKAMLNYPLTGIQTLTHFALDPANMNDTEYEYINIVFPLMRSIEIVDFEALWWFQILPTFGEEQRNTFIKNLSHFWRLRKLRLIYHCYYLQCSALKCFSTAIHHLRLLEHIEIQGSFIGSTGMRTLINSLANLQHLRSINLTNNQLGDAGFGYLAKAMTRLLDLKSLLVAENPLFSTHVVYPPGWTSFVRALKSLRGLEMLDVSRCRLSSEHLDRLGDALEELSELRILKLRGNPGLPHSNGFLVNSLPSLGKLHTLDIHIKSGLSDVYMKEILFALYSLLHFRKLHISPSSFTITHDASIDKWIIDKRPIDFS